MFRNPQRLPTGRRNMARKQTINHANIRRLATALEKTTPIRA